MKNKPPASKGTSPGGDVPEPSPARWRVALAALLSLLWITALWAQPIAVDTPRWVLFLIPDAAIGGWFDGPVSWWGLVDRGAVIGVAAVVVAQAVVGGALLLRGFPWYGHLSRSERLALSAALGLGIQSNVTLALGTAGGLQWPAATLIVALLTWGLGGSIGWGIGRWSGPIAMDEPGIDIDRPSEPAAAASWRRWPQGIAGLFAALLILRALLPPAEYDVREYHLQAPKEWWQSGAISFLPHNIYANMPMAAESQTIVAMAAFDLFGVGRDAWWWGALSGKVVLAAYAILTGVLVAGVARRLILGRWASLAADWSLVLSLAFPAVVEVASLGLIEPAVACYLAAGLLMAVASRGEASAEKAPVEQAPAEEFFTRPAATSAALGIGLAGGFAVACKYPAVLIVLPVLAATLGRQRPRGYLIFAAAVAVGGGGWYLKNWLLAGNPVYPLLGQWFGGETLTVEKVAQWNRGHEVPGYSLGGLVDSILGTLWRWRLQGWLLVPAVLWGVILGWRRPGVRWCVVCGCSVFAAWWLVTHRIERFLLPAAPLAFVIAAVGVAELIRAWGVRWATVALVALAAMNALYVAGPVLGDSRLAVDLRYLRRDDESASSISRLAEHVRWVNRNLGPEDRLLVVGDAAVFDYEVPLAYSTTFDRSPLIELTERPASEWKEAFREAGFTHLLVHWSEIQRLRSTYGFDERITRDFVDRLLQSGAIERIGAEFNEGAVEVFRVPLVPSPPNDSREQDRLHPQA